MPLIAFEEGVFCKFVVAPSLMVEWDYRQKLEGRGKA